MISLFYSCIHTISNSDSFDDSDDFDDFDDFDEFDDFDDSDNSDDSEQGYINSRNVHEGPYIHCKYLQGLQGIDRVFMYTVQGFTCYRKNL